MRGTGLSAILQNGNNAGRKVSCGGRPLTVLSLQGFTHIFRVSSKTLSGRHHTVDINREAFGAGGTWWAGWD